MALTLKEAAEYYPRAMREADLKWMEESDPLLDKALEVKAPARRRHQPQCTTCGHFVGRDVRVLRYDPLQVQCEDCTYTQDLEERQAANRVRWRMSVATESTPQGV